MINTENSTFKGFHIHCGYGEGNTPHCYLEITKQVLKLAEQLNVELQYFNLGGGICYLSEYELTTLIKQIRAMIPIQTQLFFEPGRFISKNSGFALAKIESVISRDTSIDIILDLSEQCHLRWSDATLVIPTEIIDSEALNVRVFGPTCAEIDAIGNFTLSIEQRKLLQRGNKILLGGITGYSASWNTSFNGIPIAKVVYGV
jgi:diaminopimelate decarboxylase